MNANLLRQFDSQSYARGRRNVRSWKMYIWGTNVTASSAKILGIISGYKNVITPHVKSIRSHTTISECSIKAKSGIQFRWNEAQETILPTATASAKNLLWPRNRAAYRLLIGLGKGISAEEEDSSIWVPLHSSEANYSRQSSRLNFYY